MQELLSVGQEMIWEARRLAVDKPIDEDMAAIIDFGDTEWMAYRTRPWGLIGVRFQSEYMHVHNTPVLSNQVNPIMADVMVEFRYRTLVTTGELYCDRELYSIHADGSIEATCSRGEFSASLEVGIKLMDESPGEDMSAEIFWLTGLPGPTAQQEANCRRLDQLSDIQVALPDGDPHIESLAAEVRRIEDLGEDSFQTDLTVTLHGLKNLLGQLRLLEGDDRLGTISPVSIVDDYISQA